ncbi:MAG TPA: hypothetical protein VNR18_07490, partial [Hyphomicrobiales bacterium]|nr:hypothetical protein [Hyphomicrobiales bacterium]
RVAAELAACAAERPRQLTFLGLVVGATGSPEASEMASAHIEQHFIRPLSRWLGTPKAQSRARLLCSLLMGSVIMNNIKPRSPADRQQLARQVQSIIDG